jgi:hypothetical protein
MPEYAILTNRKRAIIALIHSIFFLLIALVQMGSPRMLPIWIRIHSSLASAIALLAVYLVVTSILLVLTVVSRCALERAYFGLCSTSASAGLFRIVVGDPPLHVAGIVRVLMLSLAVWTGLIVLREHSRPTGTAGNLKIG